MGYLKVIQESYTVQQTEQYCYCFVFRGFTDHGIEYIVYEYRRDVQPTIPHERKISYHELRFKIKAPP